MKNRKKGITNFEFVLSVFVFLSTISFVAISVINEVPNLHQNSVGNIIRTKSHSVSEMLLFDTGIPSNWNATSVQRIGLSSVSGHIDINKVNNLTEICSTDIGKLRGLLGDVVINISRISDGSTIAYCKTTELPAEFIVRRSAVISPGNEIVRIDVVAA